MPQALLTLPGKVNANNALVIVVTASTTPAASTNGSKGDLPSLQGKVDASNRLFVKFV